MGCKPSGLRAGDEQTEYTSFHNCSAFSCDLCTPQPAGPAYVDRVPNLICGGVQMHGRPNLAGCEEDQWTP
ncbi:hypothetical protein KL912_004328 [Ogataea haglerorum]|nr:hypothetical protein KL915_004561 [Ogataea haglerorum]KAG7692749.1 hypothetical protein KL951_004760 [Ogataea haglerorum]KAG7746397.1 hypothetical protein KL912_004328 [Ogataea haglerorum]